MKRVSSLLLLVIALAAAAPSLALAAPLTPGDVVSRAGIQDGESVIVQGEAIGESLRAGSEHRWVNVLGGGSAIGVYMPQEMVDEISHYGDYKTFGDTVQVYGVVHFACPEHAGEFDIHAEEFLIVEPGGDRESSTEPWKLFVGAALILLALGQYRLFVYLKNRGPA